MDDSSGTRDLPREKWLRRADKAARVVLFILAILLAAHLLAVVARANERLPDEVVLARVCWSEEGSTPTDGCAAIYDVLKRVSRLAGVSFEQAARRYSSSNFEYDPGRGERAYIANLVAAHASPRSEPPAGWPELSTRRRGDVVLVRQHAPWSSYRARWGALVERARRIVRGLESSRCEEPPHHWGCPDCGDRERAESFGWKRVDCGSANNDFWATPNRERVDARRH